MAAVEEAHQVVLVPTGHIVSMTEVARLVVEGSVVVVEDHPMEAATAAVLPHMIKVHHRETWEATTATTQVHTKTIITRIKMVVTAGECPASMVQQIPLVFMIKDMETMKVRLEVMLPFK